MIGISVCGRARQRERQTPATTTSKLPQNRSASVTTIAGYLAPELIQRHFPHRFEEILPAIFLEHYVEERTPEGRLGRKATWDVLSFHSWAPRRVWLSGQERIVFGEPEWRSMPEHEVAEVIGREETRALPPEVPQQDDEGWTGMPMGL